MRITLISNFFPPTHTAGTEKRTLGYALTLQKLGHDVQVVCVGKWDEGEQYWNGYVDDVYRQIPVRRININWTLAPDPNRYLYDNPMVENYLAQWLGQWMPDIVHITSCTTLSISVINAAKALGFPVVLTLTDFWFICPRVNLLRGDGSLCNGRTTSWECLKCMLWDSKIYKGLSLVFPELVTSMILDQVSQYPTLTHNPGLRGMALDMKHRKSVLTDILNKIDCITAPSKALHDTFKDCGVLKPIKVIHSGHDLSWLKNITLEKRRDVLQVGYIGQIIPIKGLHVLLSAFINTSALNQAQLVIYGDSNKDPEYMHNLENMLKKKSNSNIKFHNAFPHERLGSVLSTIDVLVVPSQWHENNPRVIQEAFASKTPVIASDVEGISEFVHNEVNGLLFERDNPGSLGAQLLRIANEPSLLARLRAGIPPVKTMEDEVSEFLGIYKSLISSNV